MARQQETKPRHVLWVTQSSARVTGHPYLHIENVSVAWGEPDAAASTDT